MPNQFTRRSGAITNGYHATARFVVVTDTLGTPSEPAVDPTWPPVSDAIVRAFAGALRAQTGRDVEGANITTAPLDILIPTKHRQAFTISATISGSVDPNLGAHLGRAFVQAWPDLRGDHSSNIVAALTTQSDAGGRNMVKPGGIDVRFITPSTPASTPAQPAQPGSPPPPVSASRTAAQNAASALQAFVQQHLSDGLLLDSNGRMRFNATVQQNQREMFSTASDADGLYGDGTRQRMSQLGIASPATPTRPATTPSTPSTPSTPAQLPAGGEQPQGGLQPDGEGVPMWAWGVGLALIGGAGWYAYRTYSPRSNPRRRRRRRR